MGTSSEKPKGGRAGASKADAKHAWSAGRSVTQSVDALHWPWPLPTIKRRRQRLARQCRVGGRALLLDAGPFLYVPDKNEPVDSHDATKEQVPQKGAQCSHHQLRAFGCDLHGLPLYERGDVGRGDLLKV